MIIGEILFSIIMPIFLLMGVGFIIDRTFRVDLPTLSKLNFNVFVPALAFIKILDTELPLARLMNIGVFNAVHISLLYVICFLIFTVPLFRKQRKILSLGGIFYNAGNYGIPLVIFAFGDRYVDVIAIAMVFQNFVNFTFGVWLLEKESGNIKKVITGLLKVPVIHAIILALILRSLNIDLIPQIKNPLNYLAQGLVPVALLTLGIQVSRTKVSKNILSVSGVLAIRLCISPLLAFALCRFMGFTGTIASILIVTAGLPVAVNVYILALEYKKDYDLASQAVLWSTILSSITLSILLLLFR
jgi:predicted permease